MLLVIFGAGASFDSFASFRAGSLDDQDGFKGHRPPMAADLFNCGDVSASLLMNVDKVQSLAARCTRELRDGGQLEAILDRVFIDSAKNPAWTKQLMALRFYLARLFSEICKRWSEKTSGVTNYADLVAEIEQWRCEKQSPPVLYVTFNYDTLLEAALSSFLSWTIDEMHSYIAHDKVRLYKLHGSINWRQMSGLGSGVSGPHYLIENAQQITSPSEPQLGSYSEGGIYLPALAIPLLKKSDFVCPPSHREQLWTLLPEVTRIIVIGWAGKEEHFNKKVQQLLTKETVQLMIANGPKQACDDTENHLRQVWGSNFHVHKATAGFTGLLQDNQLRNFLYR